jgi:hypothetical protein
MPCRQRCLRPPRLPVSPAGLDEGRSMHLGVAGRNRTDASGITTHGSAIELRPHPNARSAMRLDGTGSNGLGGRGRTCDLMLPKHPRCQLRYTEKSRDWSAWADLNRRSSRPERDGLARLSHTPWNGLMMVATVGLEPTTPALSRRCSTGLSYATYGCLAPRDGLEPPRFRLTAGRSTH